MGRLSDKVAFVSGASKGIGAGIARALAAHGATVIVNYASSESDADRIVQEITLAGGIAWAIQGDFSKEADIRRVYTHIKAKHPRLDIVVNNAGVFSFGPIEDTTTVEFHRQFDLNVLGLLLSIREAVPLFGHEGGSIINIGSTAGNMSPANSAVYSATKGAVDSITIALSKELGPRRIRVNSLNPGFTATEGAISGGVVHTEADASMISSTPLGRIGLPGDIGPVAVFLASNDSAWVTGLKLYVSGGLTM